MATGRPTFTGSSAVVGAAILHEQPTPLRTIRPDLPEGLEQVVLKALEKDRHLRYQTAADVRADLQRQKRSSDQNAAAIPSVAAPPERHQSKRGLLAVAAAALFAAAVAAGYWAFTRPRHAKADRDRHHRVERLHQHDWRRGVRRCPPAGPDRPAAAIALPPRASRSARSPRDRDDGPAARCAADAGGRAGCLQAKRQRRRHRGIDCQSRQPVTSWGCGRPIAGPGRFSIRSSRKCPARKTCSARSAEWHARSGRASVSPSRRSRHMKSRSKKRQRHPSRR